MRAFALHCLKAQGQGQNRVGPGRLILNQSFSRYQLNETDQLRKCCRSALLGRTYDYPSSMGAFTTPIPSNAFTVRTAISVVWSLFFIVR